MLLLGRESEQARITAASSPVFLVLKYQRQTGVQKVMLRNFLFDETGAELAEYAVAVALLVAIGLVVYATLGTGINTANSETGENIQSAGGPWTPNP